jgi:hypothetical protein
VPQKRKRTSTPASAAGKKTTPASAAGKKTTKKKPQVSHCHILICPELSLTVFNCHALTIN